MHILGYLVVVTKEMGRGALVCLFTFTMDIKAFEAEKPSQPLTLHDHSKVAFESLSSRPININSLY